MKVLTVVGAPVGVKNEFKESRPLVRISFKGTPLIGWILKNERLHVDPVSKELALFAREVERRINDRLENHPDGAFIYDRPTPDSPHVRKVATADDPDVLEAIQYDPHLWDEYGDGIVAGYYVLSTYSFIKGR